MACELNSMVPEGNGAELARRVRRLLQPLQLGMMWARAMPKDARTHARTAGLRHLPRTRRGPVHAVKVGYPPALRDVKTLTLE